MYNLKPVIVKRELNALGKVNIKIRLSAQRKTRYIATEWWINPDDWNHVVGCMKSNKSNQAAVQINRLLPGRIVQIEERLATLGNSYPESSMNTIMAVARGRSGLEDFYSYADSLVVSLRNAGNESNSNVYKYTASAIKDFWIGPKLDFRDLNVAWLRSFESHMLSKGNKVNSVSARMRAIRAIFRKAIDEGVIDERYYPFNKFRIKSEKISKVSLNIQEMHRLQVAKLDGVDAVARDIFMLSFYLIGINIKDMVHLRTIDKGRINFRRSKTNRPYSVKVPPEALELIERYRGTKYLLRFVEHYKDYRETTKIANVKLKNIAKMKGVDIDYPVSTYYARYSWATIASGLGVSKDVISHALGHGTSTLTDIYIDFDLKKVDEANTKVIKAITKAS